MWRRCRSAVPTKGVKSDHIINKISIKKLTGASVGPKSLSFINNMTTADAIATYAPCAAEAAEIVNSYCSISQFGISCFRNGQAGCGLRLYQTFRAGIGHVGATQRYDTISYGKTIWLGFITVTVAAYDVAAASINYRQRHHVIATHGEAWP